MRHFTIASHNSDDATTQARWQHDHGVPDPDDTTRDYPGEATDLLMRTNYPLDRQSEWMRCRILARDPLQVLEQRWTAVPRHGSVARDHVLAMYCRHRNTPDLLGADACGELTVL